MCSIDVKIYNHPSYRYSMKIGWVKYNGYPSVMPTELLWDNHSNCFVHPSGQLITKANPFSSFDKVNPQVPFTDEEYGERYIDGTVVYVSYNHNMICFYLKELNEQHANYMSMVNEFGDQQ